jgi:hypothetical protein
MATHRLMVTKHVTSDNSKSPFFICIAFFPFVGARARRSAFWFAVATMQPSYRSTKIEGIGTICEISPLKPPPIFGPFNDMLAEPSTFPASHEPKIIAFMCPIVP